MRPRTTNFTLDEWTCRNGERYPDGWWYDRWLPLAQLCERIRLEWDGPLRVVSGFRTEDYNRKVGGARRSQHVQGRAADLQPSDPTRSRELHDLILSMYREGVIPSLGGLGRYENFVHVDIRSVPRLRRWG